MRFWKRGSVWLCLSLMLWTAAVECIHAHSTQTEATSCSICAVAHTASPAVSTNHRTPLFTAVGLFHEEDAVVKLRFDFSDHGIRGPPAIL
jgi:hypothetical protein